MKQIFKGEAVKVKVEKKSKITYERSRTKAKVAAARSITLMVSHTDLRMVLLDQAAHFRLIWLMKWTRHLRNHSGNSLLARLTKVSVEDHMALWGSMEASLVDDKDNSVNRVSLGVSRDKSSKDLHRWDNSAVNRVSWVVIRAKSSKDLHQWDSSLVNKASPAVHKDSSSRVLHRWGSLVANRDRDFRDLLHR